MQVSELFYLVDWVQTHVAKAGILKRYNALIAPLQSNLQANQQAQPFAEQKEELLRVLRLVPLDSLSSQQKDVLRQIGILQNIGEEGAALIEDVLFRNALDVANAHKQISHAQSELNRGIKWSQEAEVLLKSITPHSVDKEIEDDEVIIRARFADKAAISSVVDLKKWSNTWWEIARGVAMLSKLPPESVRVVGASNGSIILSLATVFGVAKIIALVEREILTFIERVIGIQIKIEELKALKLSNESIIVGLKEEIETSREEKVKQITTLVVKELHIHETADGELLTNFSKAVKGLLEFQEKGGQLDFVVPENEDDANGEPGETGSEADRNGELRLSKSQELQQIVSALRVIEDRIKSVGYEPKP